MPSTHSGTLTVVSDGSGERLVAIYRHRDAATSQGVLRYWTFDLAYDCGQWQAGGDVTDPQDNVLDASIIQSSFYPTPSIEVVAQVRNPGREAILDHYCWAESLLGWVRGQEFASPIDIIPTTAEYGIGGPIAKHVYEFRANPALIQSQFGVDQYLEVAVPY